MAEAFVLVAVLTASLILVFPFGNFPFTEYVEKTDEQILL